MNKILKSEQCELEKVKIELQEKTDQLTDASIENAQLQEQLGKLKHAETLHGNDLNFIKLLKSKAEEKLAEQLQFNALLKKELDQLRMTQSTSAVSLENERLKTKITELQNKSSVLVAKCDDILVSFVGH